MAEHNSRKRLAALALAAAMPAAWITPAAAAESIGAQAAQLAQSFIDQNRVTPKSDSAHKTQHTTLYESGTHIRDRIAYEVVIK